LQIGRQFVVSTQVDQQLDNKRTELLWELLANPVDKGGSHVYNLQQLVNDYPQSGLLQALLLYAGEEESLKHAAVYTNPRLLYKLSHDPDSLPVVTGGQIISFNDASGNNHFQSVDENEYLIAPYPAQPHQEETNEVAEPGNQYMITPYVEEVADEQRPEAEHEEAAAEHYHEQDFEPAQQEQPVITTADEAPHYNEAIAEDTITGVEHEELPVAQAPVEEETTPFSFAVPTEPLLDIDEDEDHHIIEPVIPLEDEEPQVFQPIDDEVYDEIVSIDDINIAQVETGNYEEPVTQAPTTPAPETTNHEPVSNERKIDFTNEAEKLILNNIAATDFFVFDRAFSDRKNTEPEPIAAAPQPAPAEAAPAPEVKVQDTAKTYERISKYNDEKMPYSFMWWLDKTRKEHSGIYQPYVDFKLDTTQSIDKNAPDELQQQYYENIFHLTSVDELERSTGQQPVEFDHKKKEDEIIERFIQEVPQIKPQTGDKLDNENKAKKSSEDKDEIVTETLAAIYAEQMMYPKAVAVYKKLMLKFPEKSRYFASQIEQIEKRTN